ncbi:hypothetical protein [Gordonia phage GTE5]|uniref:Uncharacterized protein n=1 Tax=Gordonia phage GTE5 TaxID=319522 RepID=G8EJU7_9CAUD|nr:hypothetical protein GoPhGTE5p80 [Gordonia phage GTE5]AET09829.1 hypothetical protein [Gordonia phage GTE5]
MASMDVCASIGGCAAVRRDRLCTCTCGVACDSWDMAVLASQMAVCGVCCARGVSVCLELCSWLCVALSWQYGAASGTDTPGGLPLPRPDDRGPVLEHLC